MFIQNYHCAHLKQIQRYLMFITDNASFYSCFCTSVALIYSEDRHSMQTNGIQQFSGLCHAGYGTDCVCTLPLFS